MQPSILAGNDNTVQLLDVRETISQVPVSDAVVSWELRTDLNGGGTLLDSGSGDFVESGHYKFGLDDSLALVVGEKYVVRTTAISAAAGGKAVWEDWYPCKRRTGKTNIT